MLPVVVKMPVEVPLDKRRKSLRNRAGVVVCPAYQSATTTPKARSLCPLL